MMNTVRRVFVAAAGLVAVAAGQAVTSEKVLDAYAKLPLTFVANRGQTNARVAYYAQNSRVAFYFTPQEIVLSLARGIPTRLIPAAYTGNPMGEGVALRLRFVGANRGVMPRGEAPMQSEVNYFRGNDTSGRRTHIPQYAELLYADLWPGIDLRLRDHAGTLKYEFRVRPRARPADIALAYDGALGLEGIRMARCLSEQHLASCETRPRWLTRRSTADASPWKAATG